MADTGAHEEYGSPLGTIAEEGKQNKWDNYLSQMMTTKLWVNGDLRSTMSNSGQWGDFLLLGWVKPTAFQNYQTT